MGRSAEDKKLETEKKRESELYVKESGFVLLLKKLQGLGCSVVDLYVFLDFVERHCGWEGLLEHVKYLRVCRDLGGLLVEDAYRYETDVTKEDLEKILRVVGVESECMLVDTFFTKKD